MAKDEMLLEKTSYYDRDDLRRALRQQVGPFPKFFYAQFPRDRR